VQAIFTKEMQADIRIELALSHSEKKSAKIDSVRHSKMSEVVGKVNAVLFDSSALDIVRGEPSSRRRFLDLEISQTSPRYVHALASYRKILLQRNHLLKSIKDRKSAGLQETLSSWNAQLAHFGAQLIDGRIRFLSRLSELASEHNLILSNSRDRLTLAYRPSFVLENTENASVIEEQFLRQLGRSQYEEMARGTTVIGPQRDDMTILVNDEEGRHFGSQGQQRTITLALKFAERQLMHEEIGEAPILLLDDVLSDLDDIRSNRLYELIAQSGSQTFLSCTTTRQFPTDIVAGATVWRIESGRIIGE
jgi:DNA replication and repair protein RecF